MCDSSYEQPDQQAFHHPFDAQGNKISERPHYVVHRYIQYSFKCHYNEIKENLKPKQRIQFRFHWISVWWKIMRR